MIGMKGFYIRRVGLWCPLLGYILGFTTSLSVTFPSRVYFVFELLIRNIEQTAEGNAVFLSLMASYNNSSRLITVKTGERHTVPNRA